MITRVRFENYRSHGDSEVLLHPINLLIGRAAAGKSNLMKGLLLIQNSINRSLVELFPPGLGEFQWVRSRWAGETAPIGFEVDLSGFSDRPGLIATYTLRIADSPAGLYVLEESLKRRDGDGPEEWIFRREGMRPRAMGEFGMVEPGDPTLLHRVHRGHPALVRDAPGVLFAEEVAGKLNRFGYYHLSPSELKSLGTGQAWDRIGYYGNRLPDFIAWTKLDEDNQSIYDQICASMQELHPGLESIIVTQVHAQQQGLALSFHEQRGYIAAPDLSDGTLLTLGLLSLIHSPRRAALLCIEEPDSGINPRRICWLFDRLVNLAHPTDGSEPTQVVLSTHSPWLIDLFHERREAVLLVERKQARSCVTPLVEFLKEKKSAEPLPEASSGKRWAGDVYEWL